MPETILYQGDCRQVLATLPEASVHCAITSPPYWGLRDYGLPPLVWGGDAACAHAWGEEWLVQAEGLAGSKVGKIHIGQSYQPRKEGLILKYQTSHGATCRLCGAWRGSLGLEPRPDCGGWAFGAACGACYVCHIVEVFRAVRRVLRDDGTCWVNLGDSYAGGNQGGKYSPAWTPQPDAPTSWTTRQQRTTLKTAGHGLKPKDLCGLPWRCALALQADGWWLRSDIIWAKRNPMPESVRDRPTKAHEYVFLLSKRERYFYDAEAVREAAAYGYREQPRDTWKRCALQGARVQGTTRGANPAAGRNRRSVWWLSSHAYKAAHFATFPPALVAPCLLAGTSQAGACGACGTPWPRVVERTAVLLQQTNNPRSCDQNNRGAMPRANSVARTLGFLPACRCEADPVPCTVLDPFAGAGTVALVAAQHCRASIGMELNPAYVALAEARLKEVS